MSENGGILGIVLWVILILSTVVVANYEFFPAEEGETRSFITEISTSIVDTTAGVMADTAGDLMGASMFEAALGSQFSGMDAEGLRDKKVTRCQKGLDVTLHCMSYDIKTKYFDMGNIQQVLPNGNNVAGQLDKLEACFQTGNPFKFCLYHKSEDI